MYQGGGKLFSRAMLDDLRLTLGHKKNEYSVDKSECVDTLTRATGGTLQGYSPKTNFMDVDN